jgi:AraC family transcriptional regulator
MKLSKRGQFYGNHNETIFLEKMVLNDSDYLKKGRLPWHFHENAYFTFILEGGVFEGNKKGVFECPAGSLIFHDRHEPHYNIASNKFTRGFHVEIEPSWFELYGIHSAVKERGVNISDPRIRILMYNVFKESKTSGKFRQLGIDALLLKIFSLLSKETCRSNEKNPPWLAKVRDMLHAPSSNLQLSAIAQEAGIHPVHLSREFSRYFHVNLGDYIRAIKIERALSLLPNKDLSLTDIAFECDFADQSHFIRAFKSYQQITPLRYRKLLQKK